ncbi:hypothetical protein HDV05_008171 [Chytridiales sp. JEL 0842]|nr:hypothetical protein HDV05_008171 [Chytridiales sp. JEL 0842]
MINSTFTERLFTLPSGKRMFSLYSTPDPAIRTFPFGEYAEVFLNWKVPVYTAIIYFLSVSLINRLIISANAAREKPLKSKSSALFTAFIVLHNLALCLYSAYSFWGSSQVWGKHFEGKNFKEAFCDRSGEAWTAGLNYYAWLFYLSKYYEIIDTVIILLKNRPSSLLQSYHHAGAIITMFICVASGATATWIFVVFNSFIHTIMYLYYSLTTVGIRPPGKKYLTTMQITQFVVGGSIAASYVVIPGCLKGPKSLENMEFLAYLACLSYLVPLTALFVDFAKRTYSNYVKSHAKVAAKKEQ